MIIDSLNPIWNKSMKIILLKVLQEIDLDKLKREFLFIKSVLNCHKFQFFMVNLHSYSLAIHLVTTGDDDAEVLQKAE